MFLLETSGSLVLTLRQACSVESGLRRSGRSVLLLMTAEVINVCQETFKKYFKKLVNKKFTFDLVCSLYQTSFWSTSILTLSPGKYGG